jgi:hypothetical protein
VSNSSLTKRSLRLATAWLLPGLGYQGPGRQCRRRFWYRHLPLLLTFFNEFPLMRQTTILLPAARASRWPLLGLLGLFSFQALAQTNQLSGRITDSKGVGLPGATVVVKGTTNGASTDAEGRFQLKSVPAGTVRLTVSFVGYATKEVLLATQDQGNSLVINLADNAQQVDEVVVTGVFDSRTKMESSVAISTLNSKQIQLLAPTSAADLLKTVPGVYVNQARGEINNTVYTRGISAGSIDNSNGYYYVSLQEDGLPVTNVNLNVDNFLRADVTVAARPRFWAPTRRAAFSTTCRRPAARKRRPKSARNSASKATAKTRITASMAT